MTNEPAGCPLALPPSLPSVLATLPYAAFDYVWIVGVPPQLWPKRPGLILVARNAHSALFRVDHAQPSRRR